MIQPSGADPQHGDDGPFRRSILVAAAVLAVLSVGSLAYLLLAKLAGGHPWPGLNWIAMIGLPIAFVLMGVAVVAQVRRRRRL